MKKNRKNNHTSHQSNSNNLETPDSPGSTSSRGTVKSNKAGKAKNVYDKYEDVANNNSTSSDCGTPVSSPKDPYEFRIKTEENDSDSVSDVANSRKSQKVAPNECENSDPATAEYNHSTQSKSQNGTPKLPGRSKKDKKKSIGINTSPEKPYPSDEKTCPPGTVIQLSGTVWLETTAGMLIINVTWRGRSYIGSLLDTSQHKFSPPIPQEYQPSGQNNNTNSYYSPAKGGFKSRKRNSFNIPHKLPVGRPSGKRKPVKSHIKNPSAKNMRANHRPVSESSSSIDDGSSMDDNMKEDRLNCPITECDRKFNSFNAMREHLAEHSTPPGDESSRTLVETSRDDTLINVDGNHTSDVIPTPHHEAPATKELEIKVNDSAILPPRAASVMPVTKNAEFALPEKRSEARTPSPPRLAMAHSPQPQFSTGNKHPFPHNSYSLDMLNQQSKKPKINIDLAPPPTSSPILTKNHNQCSSLHSDDPMKLFHNFKNHLNHVNNNQNSQRKESPPKLLPEVAVNESSNFLSSSVTRHPKVQSQQQGSFGRSLSDVFMTPPAVESSNRTGSSCTTSPKALNLMNNAKTPENHSIKNFISESLMAAASGKFQQSMSSTTTPQQSSDLFAAAMAKMLGVSGSNTASSLMPPMSSNPSQHLQQNKGPGPSNGNPSIMSQFDTKSLSSADYLMNLPGLLSNHQMR